MINQRSPRFQSTGCARLALWPMALLVAAIAGCPAAGVPNNNDPNDNMPNDNMPDDNDPDDGDDTPVAIGHLGALAKDDSGGLFAVDVNNDTVVGINPATGNATLISGSGRGSGPEMNAPNNLFREADGRLLVSTVGRQIYRVDPGSGERTLLVDLNDPADFFPDGITGILATADGTLFISQFSEPDIGQLDVNAMSVTPVAFVVPFIFSIDNFIHTGGATALAAGSRAIVSVELPSGTATVVSGEGQGEGPGFGQIRAIAVADDGTIYVADEANSFFGLGDTVVFSIDPATGDRTLISGPDNGSGPQLSRPRRMVIGDDGQILMLDENLDGLLIIDATTGDRTLLTVQ